VAIESSHCTTWEQSKTAVRRGHYVTEMPRARRLYRGHGDSRWRLVPPVHRVSNPAADLPEYRFNPQWEHYLETFKQSLVGMPNVNADALRNPRQLWVLGRHFGLATPLLDWTTSPYIAAFFAFWCALQRAFPGIQEGLWWGADLASLKGSRIPLDEASVTIWSLLRPVNEYGNALEHIPGAQGLVFIDERKDAFHRQKAQQAVFTRLTGPDIDLEVYLESQGKASFLTRYDLPARCFVEALAELQMMNINLANLFPDVSGAALQANVDELIHSLLSRGAA